MEIKLFLTNILTSKITNKTIIEKIKKANNFNFNNFELERVLSHLNTTPMFFSDENFYRLVSINEILDAQKTLGVNIKTLKLIPIIDCGDNDFICFNINNNCWCKFNIAEEFCFFNKNSILEYFNN